MSSASSLAEELTGADAPGERRATWLEPFFDLGFAAAVAEVSGLLGGQYDGVGLLRFALPFFLVW